MHIQINLRTDSSISQLYDKERVYEKFKRDHDAKKLLPSSEPGMKSLPDKQNNTM